MPRTSRAGFGFLLALAAAAAAPGSVAGEEDLTRPDVGVEGAGRFRTVQEAVDAAKPGDVIRIGRGAFDGAVRVEKPLTLVGAGPTETVLTSELTLAGAEADDLESRMRPTLRVDGASGVVLREIGITGRTQPAAGGVRGDAVVLVRRGAARFERCAVYGSAASGVLIGTDGEAHLERCLVGAIASDGVVHRGKTLTLVDCDVRDCVHYGVVFGRGTAGSVERCRISGSRWHGVRYDDASPAVRGNAIFDNERSGVYASGKTAATVEGNLFLRNGMSGVSCWTANGDVIRRNTFANQRREAVAVLGGSKPRIESNVFLGNPTAVLSARVAGGSAESGTLDLVGNWFWKNERDAMGTAAAGEGPAPVDWTTLEAAGNRRADPGLANPAAHDFSAPEGSPARAAGAGAAAPLSTTSPWPAELGELSRVVASAEAATPARGRPMRVRAPPADGPIAKGRAWSEAVHDLEDAARREAALAAIRAAAGSPDPAENHAAYFAVAGTTDVEWDRAALAPTIRAKVPTLRGPAQVAAFRALIAASPGPEDLDLLLRALEDPSPELDEAGSGLVVAFGKGRVEGRGERAVLLRLATPDARVRRETLRGLWGARVSPALEARLVELHRGLEGAERHDVLYFALATLEGKSPAVVAALAAATEEPQSAERAVWGLSHGVAPEATTAAADALLRIFATRAALRRDALSGLAAYGKKRHADRLEALVERAPLSESMRREVAEVVARIRARP